MASPVNMPRFANGTASSDDDLFTPASPDLFTLSPPGSTGTELRPRHPEHIEVERLDSRFVGVRDAQFTITSGIARIAKLGTEYLFTFEPDHYVGRARLVVPAKTAVHLTEGVAFPFVKQTVLESLQIHTVLCDDLTVKRNNSFSLLEDYLKHAVVNNVPYTLELGVLLASCPDPTNTLYILECIIDSTGYISDELKDIARQLYADELRMEERCQAFPCMRVGGAQEQNADVYHILRASYEAGFQQHRRGLNDEVASYKCALTDAMQKDLNDLQATPQILLGLGVDDMKMFVHIAALTDGHRHSSERERASLQKVVLSIWKDFYRNITTKLRQTVKYEQFAALTSPIYPYLYKSFLELMSELSAKTTRPLYEEFGGESLLFINNGNWILSRVTWASIPTLVEITLMRQCDFIIHMMQHHKPGQVYSRQTLTECDICVSKQGEQSGPLYWEGKPTFGEVVVTVSTWYSDQQYADVPTDRLIWLMIAKNGVRGVYFNWHETRKFGVDDEKKRLFDDLLKAIDNGFECYIRREDSVEAYRVTAYDTVRLAAQIGPYVINLRSETDKRITHLQTAFINRMMSGKNRNADASQHFPKLITEYISYFEKKAKFAVWIGEQFRSNVLQEEMRRVYEKLLTVLDSILSKQNCQPDLVVSNLRAFNDFLAYLHQTDFVWLVEDSVVEQQNFVTLVNGNKKIYFKVIDEEGYVNSFADTNLPVPKHYQLSIIQKLLSTVNKCLSTGYDADVQVKATSDLLAAIGRTFVHFDDQIDSISFEQFEIDMTQPFEVVVANMTSYENFKRQIANLDRFYLYTRKQDEIDITKALDMFESIVAKNNLKSFDAKCPRAKLQASYNLYVEEFNKLVIWNLENKNGDFVQMVREKIQQYKGSRLEWDKTSKQEKFPVILAGVAAVWSLSEQMKVKGTDRYLKPHCIQILCILRLLGVDQDLNGIASHMAEVLTGQGKSIVLGLLACVLAVCGRAVQLVCYSKYLAERDEVEFQHLFSTFRVEDHVSYGDFDDLASRALCVELNGETRAFGNVVSDLILNKLDNQRVAERKKTLKDLKTILLIDEVDVFFSEEFYGNTYRLAQTVGIPVLPEIQEKVWELVSSGLHDKKKLRKQIAEYTCDVKGESDEFDRFLFSSRDLFDEHLDIMIADAIRVHTGTADKEYINKYRLNENEDISLRRQDGVYVTNTHWSYHNVFNYFRLKVSRFEHKNYTNYGYLKVDCGEISYAKLPLEYPVILGVSGTISTLSDTEIDVVRSYNINQVSCMPTFFGGSKLTFDPLEDYHLESTVSNWHSRILKSIAAFQRNRAVLIFFDRESDIDAFRTQYRNQLRGVNILTGNEDPVERDRFIDDAGVMGTVTMATRAMGRGVDYKTTLDVEQNGGVHVIQTFLSLDVKEEVQIKGRTARKDNKGSYELVLCREHLVRDRYLGKNEDLECSFDYTMVDLFRKKLAEQKYAVNAKLVAESEEKHNLTLEFVKSFGSYAPYRRNEFLGRYRLV